MMRYGDKDIEWLYDRLESFDWRLSPVEILETEEKYPGLIDDLRIEGWQRGLIKGQLEEGKP